jgi:hypothetical protein
VGSGGREWEWFLKLFFFELALDLPAWSLGQDGATERDEETASESEKAGCLRLVGVVASRGRPDGGSRVSHPCQCHGRWSITEMFHATSHMYIVYCTLHGIVDNLTSYDMKLYLS